MAKPKTVADVRRMLGKPRRTGGPGGATQAIEPVPPLTAQSSEPFPGYDAMNVAQVLDALTYLDEAEREAVRSYEAANRRRKTVLEALE